MKIHKAAARARQAQRVLARQGGREIALRAARRAERALAAGSGPALRLRLEDVADSTALVTPTPATPVKDRPLRVGWVMTPPAAGSGGHTTMFRAVRSLETAGHTCDFYLYDVYDGDVRAHERVISANWSALRAGVHDVAEGLPLLDAWVATSWESAHVLASRPRAGGHRFYFVQDYEPYFYARGSEYVLSEDTYRFGYHGITAGAWLAEELAARFGMPCEWFEFGADTDIYQVTGDRPRDGVVFYAKPDVPRRAFALGVLALERFAQQRPGVPIHMFGGPAGRLPFAATSHGTLTPTELNALYNTCRVGLSLSLTNVSLIPWELLASGVVPVVNDAPHNRRVLSVDNVRWSPPSPAALASSLVETYDQAADSAVARQCAAGVREADWDAAGERVKRFIEAVVSRDG